MSEEDQNRKLEERLAKLEKKVAYLEQRLKQPYEEPSELSTRFSDETAGIDSTPQKRPVDWIEEFRFDEKWLNRLGIGLLLLGVAFLFKYSIDQGWLIPPIRSAIGFGIGLVLFTAGLQMHHEKKPLKQILAGGGIAVFYITGFATFQLYEFVPDAVVWIFMVTVTLLALSMSLQQNAPVLSVTGILGALGTPFMLYTGSGSVLALMIYTTLVLAAAGAIYLIKGWRSLLWSMTVGGWMVILVGMIAGLNDINPALPDRWALQGGITICATVFWVIPVLRDIYSFKEPEQWPDPVFTRNPGMDRNIIYLENPGIYILVLMVPVISLFMSMALWDFSNESWGFISMTASLPLALCYFGLRQISMSKLSSAHGFSALILLTLGFFLLFEGNVLLLVLAVEAAGLRFIAGTTGDKNISFSSHFLFVIVGYWLIALMTQNTPEVFSPGIDSLLRLVVIAIGGLMVPFWLKNTSTRNWYAVTAHILFLAWLYRFFAPLDNSQAWITITWGAYAVGLLLLGFLRFGQTLRMAGMATIFLVVAKLFLVDLSQLKAIWRILLFIGFGSIFLMLGYFWQSVWNKERAQVQSGDQFEDIS